jgi:hypothetical protein
MGGLPPDKERIMSNDNIYMVEFATGRTIHVGQSTVQDVVEYCKDRYQGEAIQSIYKEVYFSEEEIPSIDVSKCEANEGDEDSFSNLGS